MVQRAAQVQRSSLTVTTHVEEILGMGLYMYMYNHKFAEILHNICIMYVFLYDIFLCFHEMC